MSETVHYDPQTRFALCLVSEILMLTDYVAALPSYRLTQFQFTDPRPKGLRMGIGDALIALNAIAAELRNARSQEGDKRGDLAFLQVFRSELNALVAPASGMTIAYTSLIVGRLRGHQSASRAANAELAYPRLKQVAGWHRYVQHGLLVLSVLVTLAVVWEATKVSLGKSLLHNLDTLRAQQSLVVTEKAKVEAAVDRGIKEPLSLGSLIADGQIELPAFDICDRKIALQQYAKSKVGADGIPKDKTNDPLTLYLSSAERDVCEQDSVLSAHLAIVYADLDEYRRHWPVMVGSVFYVAGSIICYFPVCGPDYARAEQPPDKDKNDIEFMIAPILLVWGNYVLPLMFGLLGALIFVILDYYGKLRMNVLDPKDRYLCVIRLVLGAVTGASIGMFFSGVGSASLAPQDLQPPSNLIASVTLTSSGLAFLAGFGVEAVFKMLESLISSIFHTRERSGLARSGSNLHPGGLNVQ